MAVSWDSIHNLEEDGGGSEYRWVGVFVDQGVYLFLYVERVGVCVGGGRPFYLSGFLALHSFKNLQVLKLLRLVGCIFVYVLKMQFGFRSFVFEI